MEQKELAMKSKSLIAMAVAGTLAYSAGAFGHGFERSTEIQTPASVSESAPWLTGQPHLAGSQRMSSMASDSSMSTGASSGMSGYGSGGYDSTLSSASESPMTGRLKHVEYWLLGDESAGRSGGSIMSMRGAAYDGARSTGTMDYALSGDPSLGTGSSSSTGGSGSVAFDSRTMPSFEQDTFDSRRETTPRFITEHYLVLGGLETFDPSNALVFETGSRPERFALLEHLSRDFYVLTPFGPMSDV
jgi:hypothetical protein